MLWVKLWFKFERNVGPDARANGKIPAIVEGLGVRGSKEYFGPNDPDDEWDSGKRKGLHGYYRGRKPQQGQVNIRPPVNFQVGNPGDNPANPVIPDLDMMEKEGMRAESSRQLENRCRWLEEEFKALKNADHHPSIDAKDLSLVPDLVFPHKFKMSEFEKYNRASCPEAHIKMFCRCITSYVNNDQLLIHCFQDSLVGAASRWYNQLSHANINSWRDLDQAFMRQYNHVTNMTPDRIVLQNMEKKPNESFRQYAQRWREVVMQVQPPLLEKETIMLFINILKAPFITHMVGSTTKSFADIVMAGEMIENTIKGGKIEAGG
ncbi:Gag-pro-like protein [Gossypium australe]|uniref:Gag-pro-like protein n=1 Tax=Gossypium australe TaxID=47621 RepID=A0A5B6VSV6_9ROSI|nr:Gag-pro-like protein [Gossypium australe]